METVSVDSGKKGKKNKASKPKKDSSIKIARTTAHKNEHVRKSSRGRFKTAAELNEHRKLVSAPVVKHHKHKDPSEQFLAF